MSTGAADLKQDILNHFGGNFLSFYEKHFEGIRKGKGDQYGALCKFHDDKNQSLSFNFKTGVCYCHSCGFKGNIFKVFSELHSLNGNFPEVLKKFAAELGIKTEEAKQEKKIVKTYNYTDLDGNLVFQTVRYDPKDFRQRRPDGKGGWIWDLKGVEPVLYRLPEVLKANEIWILEGEKDCDNLAGLGFTATTNPMGAGKWRDYYNKYLAGKDVIILPDNDKPGRDHAHKIARSLYDIAKSIKIIELPGLPEKGDVSDLVDSFQDPDDAAERLSILIENAEPWEPKADEPQEHRRFYFIHNAAIELKPAEWMIRAILPKNGIIYDFGDPGSFKTFVALDRLLSIAAGISYHGHPVDQGTVFYIPGEGQQGIGRRTIAWHAAHQTKPEDVPFFVASMPTQLMDADALDEVKRAIDSMSKEYGDPAVVWFDTLSRNFGSGDENQTKDMNQVITNLDQTFGNSFFIGITHHTGHMNKDRARGAMALHGAADAAFKISLTTDDRILVECKKMKDAPAAPPMLFERREILLRIGDQDDKSYVLNLIAEGDDATRGTKKTTRLTGGKRIALESLQKCLQSQTGPIHLDIWREAAYSSGITQSTEPDSRQKAFKRAVTWLMDSRIITCEKDYYNVT